MKHLNPKNFPVLPLSQYLPSLRQGPMSTVGGAGPFMFAYISQGQVLPEWDYPGQTDATSS